ncbi:MAG: hypothetical protein JRN20_04585 [Nitrososphaerota archaeon]|nr:hypothetical protein [Nitrososphaerota archaeon]
MSRRKAKKEAHSLAKKSISNYKGKRMNKIAEGSAGVDFFNSQSSSTMDVFLLSATFHKCLQEFRYKTRTLRR